jgi:hypothetical protein
LIVKGGQSGLQTRIAAENGSLSLRIEKLSAFIELEAICSKENAKRAQGIPAVLESSS